MFNTENANCTSLDPELFFPVNNISPRIEKLLKKTCLECLIFDDCLNYSLNVKVNGYWAATTEKIRDELRKMLNIVPVRIDQHYKDLVDIPTPEAIQKRKSIKKLKEAGKR